MPATSEIELKFPLDSADEVRAGLVRLGFTSAGEVFEANIVFDTPGGELRGRHCLLRLRRDRKVKLTWKEPHEDMELAGRYKAKRESELELSDLETMRHILHRMGFTSEWVYEKYREHFTRPDGAVAELDRLPHIGRFLELEAGPEAMEEVAAALGLDTAEGIKVSYMVVFQQWCEQHGSRLSDMRFEDESGG
ncbi:MAG: class IV adenylate cyclase [Candidatus Glassbacteria bacterium]|nr:class IV adenylate cyclase [Candidatus Glassbacteria bacterium]